MVKQVQEHSQRQTAIPFTLNNDLTCAIVFSGSPALFLSFIFWAVATAFPQAGPLSSFMVSLITFLLSFLGVILLIGHITRHLLSQKQVANAALPERRLVFLGAGFVCLFLVVSIMLCLCQADTLDGWHYALILMEIVLVGYHVCLL